MIGLSVRCYAVSIEKKSQSDGVLALGGLKSDQRTTALILQMRYKEDGTFMQYIKKCVVFFENIH